MFIIADDIENDERIYTLRINNKDFMEAGLHQFDLSLLRECESSDKISDKLLALETIARRIEESR